MQKHNQFAPPTMIAPIPLEKAAFAACDDTHENGTNGTPHTAANGKALSQRRRSNYHFPFALRQCMKRCRFRQNSVAQLSGMHQGTVSRVLHGQIQCSPGHLEDFLCAFADPEQKRMLVIAFVADLLGPNAIKALRSSTTICETDFELNPRVLTLNGNDGLYFLEHNILNRAIESVSISFAKPPGWKAQKKKKDEPAPLAPIDEGTVLK